MDLRRLRLFVAVAEHGGFTAAAEAEHVAQPAVSLAIRELEQELGAPLFIRSRTGATPHRGRRGAARARPGRRSATSSTPPPPSPRSPGWWPGTSTSPASPPWPPTRWRSWSAASVASTPAWRCGWARPSTSRSWPTRCAPAPPRWASPSRARPTPGLDGDPDRRAGALRRRPRRRADQPPAPRAPRGRPARAQPHRVVAARRRRHRPGGGRRPTRRRRGDRPARRAHPPRAGRRRHHLPPRHPRPRRRAASAPPSAPPARASAARSSSSTARATPAPPPPGSSSSPGPDRRQPRCRNRLRVCHTPPAHWGHGCSGAPLARAVAHAALPGPVPPAHHLHRHQLDRLERRDGGGPAHREAGHRRPGGRRRPRRDPPVVAPRRRHRAGRGVPRLRPADPAHRAVHRARDEPPRRPLRPAPAPRRGLPRPLAVGPAPVARDDRPQRDPALHRVRRHLLRADPRAGGRHLRGPRRAAHPARPAHLRRRDPGADPLPPVPAALHGDRPPHPGPDRRPHHHHRGGRQGHPRAQGLRPRRRVVRQATRPRPRRSTPPRWSASGSTPASCGCSPSSRTSPSASCCSPACWRSAPAA